MEAGLTVGRTAKSRFVGVKRLRDEEDDDDIDDEVEEVSKLDEWMQNRKKAKREQDDSKPVCRS